MYGCRKRTEGGNSYRAAVRCHNQVTDSVKRCIKPIKAVAKSDVGISGTVLNVRIAVNSQ